ncbi:DUF6492 family protein [Microbacterium sp. Root180]|uniref:DUF6492 family protein n=1 Tax=Microbacterium sp. Root180 TaxID=1736483 RepID=UPI0006F7F20F|nr:DUF6492 family protein [Microbacterium sp. Root180]KRB37173.1 hypothetical protein ASD93_14385 [Microbacterium sp. Root180]
MQTESDRRQPLTFVTITYRAEDTLLLLQARSLALYARPDDVAAVIVIDNGSPRMSRRAQRRLLDAYGPLSDRVRIVRRSELGSDVASSGWMSQQVMKLAAHRLVETPTYVLLDAKNHLIRPVAVSDFLAEDGRARTGFQSYLSHPLLPRLRHVLEYLELDQSAAGRFPPTSTPFVAHRDVVAALVDDIETSSGRPFATEFVRADLTEFPLYSAWLLRRDGGWDPTYVDDAIQAPTVWGGNASRSGVDHAIEQARESDAPAFGVHRRALHRMDLDGLTALSAFLSERRLVSGPAEFRRLRRTFRRQYGAEILRARVSSRLRRSRA